MGVIICESPTGPFSVTVIPKSGSTTVRYILEGCAKPGQYTNHRLAPGKFKIAKTNWTLSDAYREQCIDRSWAVLRNPWRRAISRWREKTMDGRETRPWLEFLKAVRSARCNGIRPPAALRTQTTFLGNTHPKRLVALENIADWHPEMAAQEGVELGPIVHGRSQGPYDWKQYYRDYPETRDTVRKMFRLDWELGLDWEDPLA